jgi:hypothetical protein
MTAALLSFGLLNSTVSHPHSHREETTSEGALVSWVGEAASVRHASSARRITASSCGEIGRGVIALRMTAV